MNNRPAQDAGADLGTGRAYGWSCTLPERLPPERRCRLPAGPWQRFPALNLNRLVVPRPARPRAADRSDRIRQTTSGAGSHQSHPQRTHPLRSKTRSNCVPERQCAPTPTERTPAAANLRVAFREDPDVILVGETRWKPFSWRCRTGRSGLRNLHTSSAPWTAWSILPTNTKIRAALRQLVRPFCRREPAEGQFGRKMAQEILINTATANDPQQNSPALFPNQTGRTGTDPGKPNLVLNGRVPREATGKAQPTNGSG